jgi:putative alpha-1,2-mannosidase
MVYSHCPGTIVTCPADSEKGMAKAVADVNNPEEKQGGFASDDSDITGFSHMHDSGTGGVWLAQNFGEWPLISKIVTVFGKFPHFPSIWMPRRYC